MLRLRSIRCVTSWLILLIAAAVARPAALPSDRRLSKGGREGQRLLIRRRWRLAAAAFERAVERDPQHPRLAELEGLGFEVRKEEVLTPAALAVRHCRERGHRSVKLLVAEALREDLTGLGETSGGGADAIVLGDLGQGFTADVLNDAFRLLMEGAELVALQHNRYWRRADGLALDVGAYSAALEYASGRQAVVVGKPAREFFMAALAELGSDAENTLMVGDDVEADVGGAMDAGLRGILVRTGKYRRDALDSSGVTPTEIVDSIAELPRLLG